LDGSILFQPGSGAVFAILGSLGVGSIAIQSRQSGTPPRADARYVNFFYGMYQRALEFILNNDGYDEEMSDYYRNKMQKLKSVLKE
jgi:hypothetical protein